MSKNNFRLVTFGVPLLLLFLVSFFSGCHLLSSPPRVLIFSKTTGYRHESIPTGVSALYRLCTANGIEVDSTENASFFNEKNLRRYAAVIFLSTNAEVLDTRQENDFERYIQAGGGYVGIHAASATEYTWHWYGELVGGYFKDHPAMGEAHLHIEDCNHPSTAHLCNSDWVWQDEWYNFRNYEPGNHVLLTIDESAYQGGSTPGLQIPNAKHPLAWYREFDGGRSFYTALGHRNEAYADPAFLQHLLGGIRYAIGDNKPLRYGRCRTQPAPDPTRFVKTTVAEALDEPMEIALLPDDKILLIERHGRLKQSDPVSGQMEVIAKLPVYSEMGDGLIGLAVDPHYAQNHWIYLYYSSLQDSVNQLSRFIFQGDSLDRASERVLLKVAVGRYNCFHAAGGLCFDGEGNLFLSTGDNTSPFASDGYNPIDQRPHRQSFDAQRSAANAMDLRGKILRIKPLDDGNYICPAGNLFIGKDVHVIPHPSFETAELKFGRPEIYIMGCRNPFRISVDSRRHFLLWGDVGPDASKSDTARGPMGHDEINLARKAGNFGWPYFTADNQPYRAYDFETKKPGAWFDPAQPLNKSPNNTAFHDYPLPPAQPALIWYPYSKNRDFPLLGSGGRCSMAGPVYYTDQYPAETRYPEHYNGKFFIYDWMRNWIMAVTLDSLGHFNRLETFADSVKLSRPMDILIDRHGSLWVLEYGARWYSSNPDARLSRIDYISGNRPPIARLDADVTAGAGPLKVVFSAGRSIDPDGESINCEIDFGDGTEPAVVESLQSAVSHEYRKTGTFYATLRATDPAGKVAYARQTIRVGNAMPVVSWDLGSHNRSFYQSGETIPYKLRVTDAEDGSLEQGNIPVGRVDIRVDHEDRVLDPATVMPKREDNAPSEKYAYGKVLVDGSDCKSCHSVDVRVNGPSFQSIAGKYRQSDFGVRTVFRSIIYGETGAWGIGAMVPHPQIREEDAIQMSLWIVSLGDPAATEKSVPATGQITCSDGSFILQAHYRDQGSSTGLPPLDAGQTLVLRPNRLQARQCDQKSPGVSNYKPFGNDTIVLNGLKNHSWFLFRSVDLHGINSITLLTGSGSSDFQHAGGRVELRLDRADGPLAGQALIPPANGPRMVFSPLEIPLDLHEGTHVLYFVFKNDLLPDKSVTAVGWVQFNFERNTQ
jgi:cytochrome c